MDDGGLYECIASNRAGQVSHSAKLQVYGTRFYFSPLFFLLNILHFIHAFIAVDYHKHLVNDQKNFKKKLNIVKNNPQKTDKFNIKYFIKLLFPYYY